MVLPTPAAHAGAAPAQAWLAKLIRQLELSRGGVLCALSEATPTQLGPVVRALSTAAPWVNDGQSVLEVCLQAHDLLRLARESRVLLRVRVEDLEWLNLYRPIFADRELRAVLWLDEPALDGLVRKAVDLFDWVTRIVPVPAEPLPEFAIEGVRAAFGVGAPFSWMGDGLHESLAAHGCERTVELEAGVPFWRLVDELGASGVPIVSGITSEHEAWRVRMALARAGRSGTWIARDPGHMIVGMWRLHARQADWDQSEERLRAAGCPRPGLLAAWLNLEPELVEWAEKNPGMAPNGVWKPAQIAVAAAPTWVLRSRARDPEVEERRELVRGFDIAPDDAAEQVAWASGKGRWDPAGGERHAAPRLVRALRALGTNLPGPALVRAASNAGFDDVAAALAELARR